MPAATRNTQASHAKRVRARRDFEALTDRRLQAAAMFERGKRQADVAAALEVSAQTASRWYRCAVPESRVWA